MKLDQDFTDYVNARWPVLVRSAVLLGCPPGDAEDLVQNALTKCFRHWKRVRDASSPDAYVHRVLVNSYLDSRRRRWWGEGAYDRIPDLPDTADPVSEFDTRDAVNQALGVLSPAHRAVLVLRFFAHLSEPETAAALGVPLGTVKSRSARALMQLAADSGLNEVRNRTAS